nr:hypothetical protein [Rhodoferax sp. AJA081-3]
MPLQRSPFSRNVWFTASLVVAMAVLFFYTALEHKVDEAHALRFRSVRLADELRLSSDELTRMVRSYVATGDTTYKKRFQDILAVRDGLQPRPVNYNQLYWNEQLERGTQFTTGPAVSLLDLMRQAGFTAEEFEKLALAKANSDGLTHLELAAMALMDIQGPQAAASRAKALSMVFDANYHQVKSRIMRPIADFTTMVEERTQQDVQAAQDRASYLRYALILCGLTLLAMLVRTRWALRATLGPLDKVHAHITKIGQGDFSRRLWWTRGARPVCWACWHKRRPTWPAWTASAARRNRTAGVAARVPDLDGSHQHVRHRVHHRHGRPHHPRERHVQPGQWLQQCRAGRAEPPHHQVRCAARGLLGHSVENHLQWVCLAG